MTHTTENSKEVLQNELIAFAIENTWLNGCKHGWGNGYVAIPKGHPCYRMDYNEIDSKYEIQVNGGLTYSELASKKVHPSETVKNEMWIVGFDTAHSWDDMNSWPNEESVLKEAESLKEQLTNLKFTQDWQEKTDNEMKLQNYQKLLDSNRELVGLIKKVLVYDLKGPGGWLQYNTDQIESFAGDEAKMQENVAGDIRERIHKIEAAINNAKTII
jgi:hypothetical protein